MELILLTEQCLQLKLHLSVIIIVPRMGFFFLKIIVFIPNFAKYKNDDNFKITSQQTVNKIYKNYSIKFKCNFYSNNIICNIRYYISEDCMKRKIELFVTSLPYSFMGIYLDAKYGSLLGYFLGIAVLIAIIKFIKKNTIIIPIIVGTIISTLISLELTKIFLENEWNYYFKPFTAIELILFIMTVILAIELLAFMLEIKRFNIEKYWDDTLNQDEDAIREYFSHEAIIYWHNTNEKFTVEDYILANCKYPGDWSGNIERIEKRENLIITAVKVYAKDKSEFHHVISFIKLENGKIISLDEYWGEDIEAPIWRKEMGIGSKIYKLGEFYGS